MVACGPATSRDSGLFFLKATRAPEFHPSGRPKLTDLPPRIRTGPHGARLDRQNPPQFCPPQSSLSVLFFECVDAFFDARLSSLLRSLPKILETRRCTVLFCRVPLWLFILDGSPPPPLCLLFLPRGVADQREPFFCRTSKKPLFPPLSPSSRGAHAFPLRTKE